MQLMTIKTVEKDVSFQNWQKAKKLLFGSFEKNNVFLKCTFCKEGPGFLYKWIFVYFFRSFFSFD